MIDLVNRRFIPVWINIRTTPVPDIPCLDEALPGVHLDEQRYVGFLGQGFFLRSIVLSPQGTRLLNPEWGGSSLLKLVVDGHFAYAAVKPADYLQMLEKALSRLDPD